MRKGRGMCQGGEGEGNGVRVISHQNLWEFVTENRIAQLTVLEV